MFASHNGHVEVVDKFLQHGTRVDLQAEVYDYNGSPSHASRIIVSCPDARPHSLSRKRVW